MDESDYFLWIRHNPNTLQLELGISHTFLSIVNTLDQPDYESIVQWMKQATDTIIAARSKNEAELGTKSNLPN